VCLTAHTVDTTAQMVGQLLVAVLSAVYNRHHLCVALWPFVLQNYIQIVGIIVGECSA
jgi:hypothetical protein